MAKFVYRPMGIAVLVFVVVSRVLILVCCGSEELNTGLFAQVVMLYNSQLYFRPSPQPLDLPTEMTEIHEDSKASELEVQGSIQDGTANAVMLMLARNSELEGAVSSVKQLEEKFNRRYNYPWVFLNEEPFTEEFKQ